MDLAKWINFVVHPCGGILFNHEKGTVRATIWVNLDNRLSERNQTQKPPYFMTPFIRNVQKRQIHRDREQIRGCRGLGRRGRRAGTDKRYGALGERVEMLWK